MPISALPAATHLGGSVGSEGPINSTSNPSFLKNPCCFAMMSGAWSGFKNQSNTTVSFSGGFEGAAYPIVVTRNKKNNIINFFIFFIDPRFNHLYFKK